MNLNVGLLYTYLVTKRETFIELIYWTSRFTSSFNKRTSSVVRTHVRRLFWLPMSCMWSSKTIISSVFAGQVCSPYSIQIDS